MQMLRPRQELTLFQFETRNRNINLKYEEADVDKFLKRLLRATATG